MPELVDVEGFRRYFNRFARGKTVKRLLVQDGDVLRNASPSKLDRNVAGHRLGDAQRHGKWLIVPVGSGNLLFHFGMSGSLSYSHRPETREEHDRVVLALDEGELRYRTQRKLGGIWWVDSGSDPSGVTGDLGPDADRVSWDEFRERLAGRRGAVKSTLMNQEVLAGLGNELSDEILWHARIRPDTSVEALSAERLRRLYDETREVLNGAIPHGRIPETAGWLDAVRHDERAPCPRCGSVLRRDQIGGRTSVWCGRCQH